VGLTERGELLFSKLLHDLVARAEMSWEPGAPLTYGVPPVGVVQNRTRVARAFFAQAEGRNSETPAGDSVSASTRRQLRRGGNDHGEGRYDDLGSELEDTDFWN
jgi:hypothetical protein